MKKNASNNQAIYFLTELRTRLIYSCIVLFILLAVFLYFANHLYTILAYPLLKFLPEGHLIATQIISPFMVPFKLAFLAAFLTAIPFFLYQLWCFIAPALYGYERRLIWPFLLASTVLFYAGMAFAYLIIFPMLFRFLARIAPVGVVLSPDINEYLGFSIQLLMVFGVVFEIPIAMVVLVFANIVSRSRLIKMRSYAILGAFIIGMLFAPPDVFSQTVLAIPIWLLYEAGLILTKFVERK
ncbi:MAG: twin arginine-targeting protein translocase TatC [Gammaproteobacteria bacterium RIFCSPHIGHO2_12_FULL_38_14]|nr:MAG: twin arginine-targeting protein translocase TatC [Gammaproteobacteria bacterium RIFCSPHIGHO2_12_FULL_38_14]